MPPRGFKDETTLNDLSVDEQQYLMGDRGWGMNEVMNTGHCDRVDCDNYYASSKSSSFCPIKRNNTANRCGSDRLLCATCVTKFVEVPGAICNDCYADEVEGRYKQTWRCKSCGQKDEGLSENGLCINCENEYTIRDWCSSCGEVKWVSESTSICHECESRY